MSKQENPIQATNLRAVSRDLRGIKARHPYTADSIDQAVKVLEYLDQIKRARGPKLMINGLIIPLMPHRLSQSFNTKNPEKGLYYDSETINGLSFFVNREDGYIGISAGNAALLKLTLTGCPHLSLSYWILTTCMWIRRIDCG